MDKTYRKLLEIITVDNRCFMWHFYEFLNYDVDIKKNKNDKKIKK